ncbi:hypothetical protein ABZ372_38460, partial [Streptomyces sp. NPDC005921]
MTTTPAPSRLVDLFELGLDAPICLTWELTYACNLACAHCLSSSGRRDPRELSTAEAKAVIDELDEDCGLLRPARHSSWGFRDAGMIEPALSCGYV